MKKKPTQKLYIIRKYIRATSAKAAIAKDKISPVDDVWVDEEFKKQLPAAIGFMSESDEY